MSYNLVIFDLDGTLLDTTQDLLNAVNYALAQHNLSSVAMEQLKASLGNGYAYLIEHCVPQGTMPKVQQEVLASFISYYDAHAIEKTAPYTGVLDLLSALKSHGIACALVSNKGDDAAQALAAHFFKNSFISVAGQREGVRRKPAPDAVLAVMDAARTHLKNTAHDNLDKTNASLHAVYVGDTEVDLACAHNAGIDCISCTWGFRTKAQLIKAGATTLVDSTYELKTLLLDQCCS